MPADIYALQLTAAGTGAIAVILLTSEDPARASEVLEKISSLKTPGSLPPGATRRANLHDGDGTPLDDALVIRTSVAAWELHLHGGIAVVSATLETLQSLGVEVLTLEQAARLGILGPPLDAELQLALPLAVTTTAARLLLAQPDALAHWVDRWKKVLRSATPQTLWQFHSAAQWVLARSASLEYLLSPPRVAIIGPPNAGKSTLANALLGRNIAITSNIAGTTRDWVDAQAIFTSKAKSPARIAVTLIDTAGIRQTSDPLETQSITRTHEQAAAADAIIVLFDATQPLSREDLQLAQPRQNVPVIVAANKMDVADSLPQVLAPFNPIPLSAKDGRGIEALMDRILHGLDLSDPDPATPFAFSPRLQALFIQLALISTPGEALDLLAKMF